MGEAIEKFIKRWKDSGGSELANSQSFLKELCALLGVDEPPPMAAGDAAPAYAFERQVSITNPDGSISHGRIDLYKRGCFVLESKQGTLREEGQAPLFKDLPKPLARKGAAVRHTRGWDEVMMRAKGQAERYVRHLPPEEGRPPFIIVVDVGHSIELYSEFSMTGGAYVHFPDPQSHRILLKDLAQPGVLDLLRLVWTDPLALDPSRRAAKVTRDIASHLAGLAKLLEAAGHRPHDVATFLMRCLFTMFAEDVGLLPSKGFARMLADVEAEPAKFKPMVEDLWRQMKTGGFSSYMMENIPHFNGYLFAEAWALELDLGQVRLLTEAAKADWRDVEPAIFGTLLERALDPVERHKLGAHYTPRTYVERLVVPTIVEPLRAEWDGVKAAVVSLARQDEEGKAAEELTAFLRRLCEVRILDPACGTGNFLYVSLEHLKRLEGEVLEMLGMFGQHQKGFELASGLTVDPHQFLGIEINPRAAAIAELVLWIGYLQWHFRTHGQTNPPEPIIRDFKNIECRDAVLAYDRAEPVIDPDTLKPITRWDGRTYKKSPVTGEDVPDESARVLVERYINPRKATWPEADFIVGNPPFIGNKRMRSSLGDGYVDTLRKVWREVPGSVDYVLYWWNKAALLLGKKQIDQFGFVTTNSITQTLNRKLIHNHLFGKNPISIIFAMPDHPWVDSDEGADVRIAMTTCGFGERPGRISLINSEKRTKYDESVVTLTDVYGMVRDDISIGVDISVATELEANINLSFQGPIPVGEGFRVDATELSGLGYSWDNLPPVIKKYVIGRDIMGRFEERFIIDLFGYELEDANKNYPQLIQKLLVDVKPFRDANNDQYFKRNWWLWGRPRPEMRAAIKGLDKYIATCRTARHRVFVFLDKCVMPDTKLIIIASSKPSHLGVLSSRIHIVWSNRIGGWLGIGNDSTYNHSDCFPRFPFPLLGNAMEEYIGHIATRLELHRKQRLKDHPDLTMTGMYNVLEKLKAGEPLTDADRAIHEKGLVSVLKQIHDELDAAVFEAYGWPPTLSDEEILERLVALNKERAAEEAQGIIRWLRPEYQAPQTQPHTQVALIPDAGPAPAAGEMKKQPWPSGMAAQAQAVRQALESLGAPADVATVAKCFHRAPKAKVEELLETLAGLGQARALGGGRYAAN